MSVTGKITSCRDHSPEGPASLKAIMSLLKRKATVVDEDEIFDKGAVSRGTHAETDEAAHVLGSMGLNR